MFQKGIHLEKNCFLSKLLKNGLLVLIQTKYKLMLAAPHFSKKCTYQNQNFISNPMFSKEHFN